MLVIIRLYTTYVLDGKKLPKKLPVKTPLG